MIFQAHQLLLNVATIGEQRGLLDNAVLVNAAGKPFLQSRF